jgi:hypothetical protein
VISKHGNDWNCNSEKSGGVTFPETRCIRFVGHKKYQDLWANFNWGEMCCWHLWQGRRVWLHKCAFVRRSRFVSCVCTHFHMFAYLFVHICLHLTYTHTILGNERITIFLKGQLHDTCTHPWSHESHMSRLRWEVMCTHTLSYKLTLVWQCMCTRNCKEQLDVHIPTWRSWHSVPHRDFKGVHFLWDFLIVWQIVTRQWKLRSVCADVRRKRDYSCVLLPFKN